MTADIIQHYDLHEIYSFLNHHLFKGKLPQNVYLQVSYKLKTEGQFLPNKHELNQEAYHEIAIEESLLDGDRDYMIMVLVHQMVHLWQWEHGDQKTNKHYHNREFIKMMNSLGIEASSIDGYAVEQSILEAGELRKVIIMGDSKLKTRVKPRNAGAYLDAASQGKSTSKNKYMCVGCGTQLYGKTGLKIVCSKCAPELIEKYPMFQMISSKE